MTLRARVKTACEIARIDPGRLNEAIHDGHYLCAPETRPGSARIFDVDQIVCLKVFGILLSAKMSIEQAGSIACGAYGQFVGREDVARVVWVNRKNGTWDLVTRLVSDDDTMPRVGMFFEIPYLREEVIKRLVSLRDNQVVGED